MLRDVAEHRRALEEASMRIVLVHAQEDPRALFEPHGLEYVARVADPEYAVHRALGLGEKRSLLGGTRQLAGVFVLRDGEVAATLGDPETFHMPPRIRRSAQFVRRDGEYLSPISRGVVSKS